MVEFIKDVKWLSFHLQYAEDKRDNNNSFLPTGKMIQADTINAGFSSFGTEIDLHLDPSKDLGVQSKWYLRLTLELRWMRLLRLIISVNFNEFELTITCRHDCFEDFDEVIV